MDLETLLKDSDNLFIKLDEIKRYAAKVWKVPLLPWFTEHNMDHSQRIIDILGQILEPFSLQNKFLNRHELFVLLAAAYLHDVGMQDLTRVGKMINNLNEDDYEIIRRQHAAISCDIIVNGKLHNDASSEELPFPSLDTDYKHAIAYVAKGHSSTYFNEVLDIFQQEDMTTLNTLPFRGGFLASLLLIADELDLTYLRVNMEHQAQFTLNNLSRVHWFTHYYTNRVSIENAIAEITMIFPDPYAEYAQMFTAFVDEKLKKQLALINPVLRQNLPLLKLECRVKAVKTGKRPAPPEEVVNKLREIMQYGQPPHSLKTVFDDGSVRLVKFIYKFIPYGTKVTSDNHNPDWQIKKNRIFFDVGSTLNIGAIDLHDSQGYRFKGKTYESATAVIYLSPNLVTENITEDAKEVELCMHRSPDFDCFASTYITEHLISHRGQLPENCELLVEYAEDVDKATMEINQNCLNTPFVIANVLDEIIRLKNSELSPAEVSERTLIRGVELVDYSMKRLKDLNSGDKSLYNPALLSNAVLFQEEYEMIKNDYEQYIMDIEENVAYQVEGQLLLRDNPVPATVYGLFWHDKPRCVLAKYWARSDYFHSPDSKGFDLTLIPLLNKDHMIQHADLGSIPVSRVIIALKPNSKFSLKGLAIMLEKAEVDKEEVLFGDRKDRWRGRSNRRYPESWCTNKDPWYDGREHGYSIVDSPYVGSLLSIDEIETITLKYLKLILPDKDVV